MTYIQIYLDDIFSVENILKSRGFSVDETGGNDALILRGMRLPKNQVGLTGRHSDTELVYEIFNSSSLRSELKNLIEGKIDKVSSEKINDLIAHQNFIKDRQAYSTTFEWYVGELMVRDYAALSSSFGVKIADLYRKSNTGAEAGDFDVISILRNMGVAYFECKTGGFNKNKILKCVERSVALHCEFSIMFIDNEINESALKQMLSNVSYPLVNLNFLKKISLTHSDTSIYSWMNCYFINSSTDISNQFNIALRINEAKKIADHYTSDWASDDYKDLGYEVTELLINSS